MSNPDFSGPYWQDNSDLDRAPAAYRNGGGSRDDAPDGWPGEWTRGYSPAAASSGPAGSGRGSRSRRRDDRGDAGTPRRERDGYDLGGSSYPAYDPYPAGRNGNGSNGHAANGSNGGRRSGRNGHAEPGENGYPPSGRSGSSRRRRPGTDQGDGYTRDSYSAEDGGYGAGPGHGSGSARNGDSYRDDGYGTRRTAAYRSGTGLADDDLVPLPGGGGFGDDWGPGGPGYGGGGPGGPDDPYGPGGRGPRGLVGPGRRGVRAPGGPRRKGSWWRHWTLRKAALLMSCMALVVVLVLIAGFFYLYNSVQLPLKELSTPLNQSSVVYYSDGKTEIGCFCSQNRTNLSQPQLASDKYLEQAFFAAEDRHYLTEGGISLTGTARAILVDLTGNGYQGGSTITEQFVKTYFDPSGLGNLTYKEKIKEIIDAIKLAKAENKQWILQHYLNAIYLGDGAYGVEAAAETYFGVHAYQVGVGQAAMLAAMVQAPSAFDPRKPTQVISGLGYSLLDRWVSTLVNMAGDTYPDGTPVITQAQLHKLVPDPSNPQSALKNFPKIAKANSATASWKGFRGYIMAAVLRELVQRYHYKADQIGSLGLQITTTYSLRKMHALYAAVAEAKKMMRQYGRPLPWYAHIGAILEDPKTGGIEASYGGPSYTLPAKQCTRLRCQYDMAMVARNQVGSSFKPYVLAGAVKQGMNVVTSKLNGYWPLCVPPDTMPLVRSKLQKAGACPTMWLPVAKDPVAAPGPMSVKDAAALSSNPAFEDLAHRVTTKYIIKLAKSFGVNISHAYSTAHPNGDGSGLVDDVGKVGIALGIAPLTVEEQATTFATLADDGVYHTPHVIAKLVQNGVNKQLKVRTLRVLTHAQAADTDWALSFDTIYGTGVPNAQLSPPRPTIAKTGTTDVAQSAFFIGAFPGQMSLGVGMFTNSQNNTTGGQTLDYLPSIGGTGGGFGGAWPATIWRLTMERLLAKSHLPVAQLSPLDLNGFQKWIQAVPPKPKCKFGFGGGNGGPGGGNGGPGNGNGHGKHGVVPAAYLGPPQKCQKSPSPGPSPSGFPSPGPSPSPSGFPSPSPSGSPSPSPVGPAQPAQAPSRRQRVTSAPSLTAAAVLPRPASSKPARAPLTTGLT